MDERKIMDFSKMIASIQKNPEQKKQLENCKSLDEIHDLIKNAYPQYDFSEEELKMCFIAFAYTLEDQEENLRQLKDEQMEVSGGKMSYEDQKLIDDSLDRWKSRGQSLKKAATMGELMGEVMGMMDAENFDPGAMVQSVNDKVQKMFSSKNTDRFTATGMIDSGDRLNRAITKTVKDYSSRSNLYDDRRIGKLTKDMLTGREEQHRYYDMGQIF